MQPIVTDRVVWSVCLSVCWSVTIVNPANMAELNEMSFWMWTLVGPRTRGCHCSPFTLQQLNQHYT